MVFSDVTNGQGLIQDITFLTGASLTEYPIADRTRNINEHSRRVLTTILNAQDEWDFDDNNHTDFPILTTNLIANQQDYSLPIADEGMLKIKRVEVTYDGTNRYRANSIDINEISKATDATTIAQEFNTTSPFFDLQYGSLFLYPIPTTDVINGLNILIDRDISPFVVGDTTRTPGFDSVFHRILSYGAAYDWALARGGKNIQNLYAEYLRMMQELAEFYSSKQKDRNIILKASYENYK